MLIDAYTHFAPPALLSYLEERSGGPLVFSKLFAKIPLLTDVEKRVEFMDQNQVSMHCLIPLPWLDAVPAVASKAEWCEEACDIANSEMAAVVSRYPGRFVGVALLPPGKAISGEGGGEMLTRVLNKVIEGGKLKGFSLFVGPTALPLDHPAFDPIFAKAHETGLPIWIHPNRPQFFADYEAYRKEGSLYQIWNTLGWIYDTSVAMVHICMAKVFRRYPQIKIVTHHHGGMIPFFTDRFTIQTANFEGEEDYGLLRDLHLFYCDTATFGTQPLNIQQAIDFFTIDRVLFGTDTPMDMSSPGFFHETAKASVDKLALSDQDKEKIFYKNFLTMSTQVTIAR